MILLVPEEPAVYRRPCLSSLILVVFGKNRFDTPSHTHTTQRQQRVQLRKEGRTGRRAELRKEGWKTGDDGAHRLKRRVS